MRILVISDIHGNYPALAAVARQEGHSWDLVLHLGDAVVYAPFANQTLDWLRQQQAVAILGNTDRLVRRLLRGKSFRRPKDPEKRIMYTHTAQQLTPGSRSFLLGLKKRHRLDLAGWRLLMVHGSPADPEEFLFAHTPDSRLNELASGCQADIVLCGHSHHQFHRRVAGVHFLNPGSVGRMFDGHPDAAYAVLTLQAQKLHVQLCRCPYPIAEVEAAIRAAGLPEIYATMYRLGRKLN
jgi:putative phosphoesterase